MRDSDAPEGRNRPCTHLRTGANSHFDSPHLTISRPNCFMYQTVTLARQIEGCKPLPNQLSSVFFSLKTNSLNYVSIFI